MYHMFYFKARFRVNICGCCSENRLESNTFETNTERVRTTRTRSELLILLADLFCYRNLTRSNELHIKYTTGIEYESKLFYTPRYKENKQYDRMYDVRIFYIYTLGINTHGL